jgi:glycerophosphoryl diester phosphodiesterase
MIEFDVSLCRSGEAVVMHDLDVDSRTDGTGPILDYTLEELKRLDAGEGERIPTLQEVIDFVDGRCPLNIEIKGPGSAKAVAKAIAGEIEKGRPSDDFQVSSFNHVELKRFIELMPEIRTGLLLGCLPLSLAEMAEEIGAWSVNLDKELLSPEIVEDAHARGLKVLVFTVNTARDLARMEELSVDGVFTNDLYRLQGRERK